ncbi:MAG: hypothetical protein J5773_06970 [Verrucomicrobia bacterium]|nr:hypothetical protein [Verrucomicrobiota bacterium]MBO4796555.1 hypothetical protein [Verrucomicrobiota bacterium]
MGLKESLKGWQITGRGAAQRNPCSDITHIEVPKATTDERQHINNKKFNNR